MSMSYEVSIEPLVIVVASILHPNFNWKNVDITNKREMDCMQLNALVTDYLLSVVCAEISDIILEDKEMRENAYLIWKFLKNLYDKNCSVSSVTITSHQESSAKSQEDKDSKDIDSTPEMSAKPEVPDSEPGSSGLENNAEIYQSNDESASNCSTQSHYDIDSGSDCDSDDDDEELMFELRKVSKKSRETILGLMKKVMKQDQEIKKQKTVLNKKDDEIKCLALVEERNHALKTELDELTSKHMAGFTKLNKEKQSWYEQVVVEDCNDDLALENEVLKQEVERLSQDLSKLKGKSIVQPSQDNRETMVKKLEKGSTVQNSRNLIHKSKESKSQTKKKNLAHVKCFNCSNMGHYASMCSFNQKGQQTLSKRQRSLAKRRCFGCCKMGHRIATCLDKSSKPRSSGVYNPEVPVLKSQWHFRLNKGFKKAQEKYLEKKAVKDSKNNPSSNIKHKDCPNGNSPKPNLINIVPLCYRIPSNGVGAGRMMSSSTTRPKAIWICGGAIALVTLHEYLQVLKTQERSKTHGLHSVKKIWKTRKFRIYNSEVLDFQKNHSREISTERQ
ncbi:hypothetical protein PVAP13_3KG494901 [Panicum virgatum]|uniref:CCHC-type domain-containing protein n=1 Tax=Panicum virgatum TaxID=38727 RepID=A0A8T0VEF2_PANVG|nr:hypothetical protein PVAP13_3KG494901 [Panicum virgatum]